MFGNLFNQKRFVQDDTQKGNVSGSTTTTTVQSSQIGIPVIPVVAPFSTSTKTETHEVTSVPAPTSPAAVDVQPGAPAAQENKGSDEKAMDPGKRENLTALSRLDPRTTQVLNQAQQEAKRVKQALIEPDQLLYGLLYDREIFKLLEQFQTDGAKISQEIQSREKAGTFNGQPTLSEPSRQIFEEAYNISKNRGASFVSPEDLLLSIFSSASSSEYLSQKGITRETVEEKLSKTAGYTVAKRSTLEKYAIDLTAEAREGRLDPVTGRDREIERLIHILLRRTKNNPIIIGEAGVGKTAIVEGLAQKIVDGSVPADLSQRRIMELDIASLVAGASHRGEFEERLKAVIKETQAASGQVILFIDEIHTLIGTGDSDGALDASNIIKPYLARGQLQLIGTTTTAEYRKYFEKDKAFERRFQPVLADEPEEDVAIKMLEVLKPKYEKFHNVTFSKEAVEAAVHLSKKYIGERFLPDKGVDLLDESGSEVKLRNAAGKEGGSEVKKTDVEKVVSAWTGIPITKLTEDEGEKLIKLEEIIHKRFIDQEEAVVAVSEAVRRGRIGLSAASRPIASFLFLGPTGVGKTELAKTLAEIMFGKEEAMTRLDMSEYMEKHEVAKLIGAPPGYVGYEEGGQLTEAVRTKPYSIVLLDEVEKAHPDVFNIMLQVLEDGRLTDNKGNTISFKNTIIIATSNIGSSLIQQKLSEQGGVQSEEQFQKNFEDLSKVLVDELHKFFRPEFLNRFDELVMFKPLQQKDMAQIAKLGIGKTQKLLKEQGYELTISDKALEALAREGYDPVYGARPLRRLTQTAIENPISLLIIGKSFVPGDVIMVDFDAVKEEYTFTKGAQKSDAATDPTKAQSENGEKKDEPVTEKKEEANPGTPDASKAAQSPVSETSGNNEQAAVKDPVYGYDNQGMTPLQSQDNPVVPPPAPNGMASTIPVSVGGAGTAMQPQS